MVVIYSKKNNNFSEFTTKSSRNTLIYETVHYEIYLSSLVSCLPRFPAFIYRLLMFSVFRFKNFLHILENNSSPDMSLARIAPRLGSVFSVSNRKYFSTTCSETYCVSSSPNRNITENTNELSACTILQRITAIHKHTEKMWECIYILS